MIKTVLVLVVLLILFARACQSSDASKIVDIQGNRPRFFFWIDSEKVDVIKRAQNHRYKDQAPEEEFVIHHSFIIYVSRYHNNLDQVLKIENGNEDDRDCSFLLEFVSFLDPSSDKFNIALNLKVREVCVFMPTGLVYVKSSFSDLPYSYKRHESRVCVFLVEC